MGTQASPINSAVPPPPPGFTLDSPQSAGIPPPPPGFTLDAPMPAKLPPRGVSQPTISAPQTSAEDVLGEIAKAPSDPIGLVGDAIDKIRHMLIESEHPSARAVGDKLTDAKELLLGGQAADKPMGTRSGVMNNPVTMAVSAAPAAADLAAGAEEAIASAKPMPQGEVPPPKVPLVRRIARGPSGSGEVDVPYAPEAVNRELEAKIPRNEPPEARGEMYEDLAKRRVQRGKEQAQIDRQTARESKANEPKIIKPSDRATARIGNEGRAATWQTEDLYRLIQDPDIDLPTKREAITQLVLRGKELPPNARYLLGDPTHGSATYNPREVTRFTPEGMPLKHGGKKLTDVKEE